MIPLDDPVAVGAILAALVLGGILKGALGMGSPVIAVPVMASFFDVRLAVVIMVLPNLITNLSQLWKYRAHHLSDGFGVRYALAGAFGALIGTFLLAALSAAVLSNMVALAVIAYIVLRLLRPDFHLGKTWAHRLVGPIGIMAGALQGAAGISAPISVSFLNAMRLPRQVFIPTISLFFAAMTLAQIPMQIWLGLMTPQLALIGIGAVVPLLVFMPVGVWMARAISAQTFDRIVLVFLALLALKLIIDAF